MADDALALDALPSLTRLVLSSPVVCQKDLGRLACVSRRLRDAARDERLPAWARVRVVGTLTWHDVHHETFKEGGVDALLPPKPPRHARSYTTVSDPYEDYLEDAIQSDKALRDELYFDAVANDGRRRGELTRHVKAAWEQQGGHMRAAYASKLAASSAAHRTKAAAYADASVPCPLSPSHLDALLACCASGVHTLVLPVPLRGLGGAAERPRLVVRDDTLSRIASSWGATLRILNHGCAVVGRAALHVAREDMFAWFPSPPHTALRSVALPSCPGKLIWLVRHATKAFPKVKDIEMNTVQADPWFGDTSGERWRPRRAQLGRLASSASSARHSSQRRSRRDLITTAAATTAATET